MTSIKIKSNYKGIVVIDNDVIKTYDNDFTPSTFNLVFNEGYFIIDNSKNDDQYDQYHFGMSCVLNTLEVKSGIYHIKIETDELFTLIQKRTIVYLYNDIQSMIVHNYGSELIGRNYIKRLSFHAVDAVIKNLNVCHLHMIVEKYSIIHLNCYGFHTLKLDNTSEVIINKIKVNSKL